MMLEQSLIEYAAPTLAGLKAASLYSYCFAPSEKLEDGLSALNDQLRSRGVRMITLGSCRANTDKALLYVYRPTMLQKILRQPAVKEFLASMGYRKNWGEEECLAFLSGRLRPCENFPHEIGVFLGYPLWDVLGFIRNRGENYRLRGLWKVYGDAAQAQKRFDMYSHCTDVYRRCYCKGRTIHQLTVAC